MVRVTAGGRDRVEYHMLYRQGIQFLVNDQLIMNYAWNVAEEVNGDYTYKLGNLGIGDQYDCQCKLYYFQAEQDGVTVRRLVPARRDRDQVNGLFDQVNGAFYCDNFTQVGAVVDDSNRYWVKPYTNSVDSAANHLVLAEDTTYYVHYYTLDNAGRPSAVKTKSFYVNACEHVYGDWTFVSFTADGMVNQQRSCALCHDEQQRTIFPYAHQVTMTNALDGLTLTVTLYARQSTPLTTDDFLATLNGEGTVESCYGTVRAYDPTAQTWQQTVTVVAPYSTDPLHMFQYHYWRGSVCVTVVTNFTRLTFVDYVTNNFPGAFPETSVQS